MFFDRLLLFLCLSILVCAWHRVECGAGDFAATGIEATQPNLLAYSRSGQADAADARSVASKAQDGDAGVQGVMEGGKLLRGRKDQKLFFHKLPKGRTPPAGPSCSATSACAPGH